MPGGETVGRENPAGLIERVRRDSLRALEIIQRAYVRRNAGFLLCWRYAAEMHLVKTYTAEVLQYVFIRDSTVRESQACRAFAYLQGNLLRLKQMTRQALSPGRQIGYLPLQLRLRFAEEEKALTLSPWP